MEQNDNTVCGKSLDSGDVEEETMINVSFGGDDSFNIMTMPVVILSNGCDKKFLNSNEDLQLLHSLETTTDENLNMVVQSGSETGQACENIVLLTEHDTPSTSNDNNNPQLLSNPIQELHHAEETERRVKTRKVVRKVGEWKRNIRKIKHQSGEEYVNSRGKLVKAKEITNKKDCLKNCKYKCALNINEADRKKQFKSYYTSDQNRKYHFILNTTEKLVKARSTKSNEMSRRNYSFKYHFFVNDKKIQVCKAFYLGTLNISQKPIYNVHSNKNKCTGLPPTDMRGKYKNRYSISADSRQSVVNHIQSFPTIESHYCRSRTSKKYLESHLSIEKMYQLYLEKCQEENIRPVKSSMYRNIFCTEFNLDFHKPKSDRCAKCEAFIVSKRENLLKDEEKEHYNLHILEKNKMREEKKQDKENKEIPILSFDLQNVITCPRSEISPLFYYKKLNIYNLTAYLSTTKKVYCALWTECTSGRSGNDLASAMIQILKRVVDDNQITDLVTWSDSCVPQNRNSFMSYAIINFLRENPDINSITLKYSVPGHSAIQEVDSVHSVIERALTKTEFYSPLGLMRILKTINRSNPYCIIQMKPENFKDYAGCTQQYNFKTVPFSSVAMLKFINNLCYEVYYKKSFNEINFSTASIKGRSSVTSFATPQPIHQNHTKNDKREHFIKMMRFVSIQDRNFYQALFSLTEEELKKVTESEDLSHYNNESLQQTNASQNEQGISGISPLGRRTRTQTTKKGKKVTKSTAEKKKL